MDPRHAGHLARRQLGEPPVVLARQVVPHAAEFRLDQVGVIEVPFGGGGEEFTAVDVLGQDPVGLPQQAGVVVQAEEEGLGPAAGVAGQGEAGREHPGPFLQPLDAEEFAAERELPLGAAAAEYAEQGGR